MNTQYPPTGQPRPTQIISLEYIPQPGLGGLSIKNFLLRVITLGIYGAWAKTNVRKHIWSCVRIMGEPLEYTGTGKELFLGMLIVVGIVILPLVVVPQIVILTLGQDHPASIVVQILQPVMILYLIGVGIYRARRYRLSRTLWRGIRGTLAGSPWYYAWRNFYMMLLLPITLLWSYPWMRIRLNSHIMNDTVIGSAPFRFEGSAGPLYKKFAVLWFSAIIIFALLAVVLWVADNGQSAADSGDIFTGMTPESAGVLLVAFVIVFVPAFSLLFSIFWAVYIAAELNYFAKCTGIEGIRFGMNATTLSLVGLAVGNFFILLLSLSIATPFVQQRLVRYLCDRLILSGSLDVAAIQQSQAEVDRRGEGLAEVFDIDAF